MTCYEKAVTLDPEYAHAWFNKAVIEDQVGRRRDAVHSYERFLVVASPQDMMQITHARRRLRDLARQ
jgi:predicted TPR repeat methyltransferase